MWDAAAFREFFGEHDIIDEKGRRRCVGSGTEIRPPLTRLKSGSSST
jgi:hypothetical protein